MTELLACPFCGGKAAVIIYQDDNRDVYAAVCAVHCRGGYHESRDEAIAAWNRRVSPTIPHRGVVNAADQPDPLGR